VCAAAVAELSCGVCLCAPWRASEAAASLSGTSCTYRDHPAACEPHPRPERSWTACWHIRTPAVGGCNRTLSSVCFTAADSFSFSLLQGLSTSLCCAAVGSAASAGPRPSPAAAAAPGPGRASPASEPCCTGNDPVPGFCCLSPALACGGPKQQNIPGEQGERPRPPVDQ
jgi:hypothetical protein